MPERAIQVFSLPDEKTIKEITFAVPSLNMYRFGDFGPGMVEISGLNESLDSIALTFHIENQSELMLPGNRLLAWPWWKSLRRIGGEPWPKVYSRDHNHLLSIDEDADDYFDQSKTGSSSKGMTKTRHGVAEKNRAYELLRQGLGKIEIEDITGIPYSTLKKYGRNVKDGVRNCVSAADDHRSKAIPLMKFENGEKHHPLSISEQRQVVELLKAGVGHRVVAAMYDVCARDVRLLGVRPDSPESHA